MTSIEIIKKTMLYGLQQAIMRDDQYSTIELLTTVDGNTKDQYGWAPVHYAALYGKLAVLDVLVNHPDINVNQTTEHESWTALHIACIDVPYYRESQRYRQGLDLSELKEAHPMMSASINLSETQRCQILTLLLSNVKVDPTLSDQEGFAPIHQVIQYRFIEPLCLLLDHARIDINQISQREGDTPLHIACGDPGEMATLLLADLRIAILTKNHDDRLAIQNALAAYGRALYDEQQSTDIILKVIKMFQDRYVDIANADNTEVATLVKEFANILGQYTSQS